MDTKEKRALIKGPLRPVPCQISTLSYTQPPASKKELTPRRPEERDIVTTEFSSAAVPHPFLDPSIIQRRIQAEKQWKLDQERISKQSSMSNTHRNP